MDNYVRENDAKIGDGQPAKIMTKSSVSPVFKAEEDQNEQKDGKAKNIETNVGHLNDIVHLPSVLYDSGHLKYNLCMFHVL